MRGGRKILATAGRRRLTLVLLAALASTAPVIGFDLDASSDLDAASAERFARLALACVHQEYPNKISHVLQNDEDVLPARRLTPVFYGCYDWHSAVHAHWLLARLARTLPDTPFAERAREALGRSLTTERITAEVRYLEGAGRTTFERR